MKEKQDKKLDEQEMAEVLNDNSATDDTSGSDYGQKIVELTNDLQRTRADFENYRKQVEAQKNQAMSVAKYATVVKFLPLIDDIDRAISAYPEQLSPLAKNLEKTLKSLDLQKINSEAGVEFNPDFHEAVSVNDEGGDLEVVAETLRSGYLYNNEVVRPAMVKVQRIVAKA